MEDVRRFLTSAWRGVDAAQGRGRDFLSRAGRTSGRAGKTLCLVGSRGSRPQERSWSVAVTPGPVPVLGWRHGESFWEGWRDASGMEGPGGQSWEGSRSSAPLRMGSGQEPWVEAPGKTHLPCGAGAPGPPRKHLVPYRTASSAQESGAVLAKASVAHWQSAARGPRVALARLVVAGGPGADLAWLIAAASPQPAGQWPELQV